MTLMPVYGAPYTGVKTINPANELDISGVVTGTVKNVDWALADRFVVFTLSSGTARAYMFDAAANYRLGGATQYLSSDVLTASVGGSPAFYGMSAYGGADNPDYVAAREPGTGESNTHIERYDNGSAGSAFAGQKLDTGLTGEIGCVRIVDSGTKLVYNKGDTFYTRTLSSAGDLTTAGSASSQTLTEGTISTSDGFDFNTDGSKLYVQDGNNVLEYTLSTDFDISSRAYVGSTNVTSTAFVAHMTGDFVTVGGSTLKRAEI